MNLGNPIETIVHHILIQGMNGLSSLSRCVYHGEYINVCHAHWTGPMVSNDVRLSIIMIHQATILHGLLTLEGD